jgi:thiamine-phosphate pyrophosphorylase
VTDLTPCRLYGIVDLNYVDACDAARVTEKMIEGDVDLIQLRGKEKAVEELIDLAAQLHIITSRASIPLIVNDHVEVAREVPVEGVHVGQDDEGVVIVREKAGRN